MGLRCLVISWCLSCGSLSGQITRLSEAVVEWPAHDLRRYRGDTLTPVTILDEQAVFYLNEGQNERITRRVLLRVNTGRGVAAAGALTLPESFNEVYDAEAHTSVYRTGSAIPQVNSLKVVQFAVRLRKRNRWEEIPYTYKEVKFPRKNAGPDSGEVVLAKFFLAHLVPGDTLEYYYEVIFVEDYGSNHFFFSQRYPKARARFDFVYRQDNRREIVFPVHIPDSLVKTNLKLSEGDTVVTKTIQVQKVPGINNPQNAFMGATMPHVFVDPGRYHRQPDIARHGRIREINRPGGDNPFVWDVQADTITHELPFSRHRAVMHRFLKRFPKPKDDSSRVRFLRQLTDTLNSFRFVSRHADESASGRHARSVTVESLLHRRLPENERLRVYADILDESHIFYYTANLIDNRFGDHSKEFRVHRPMEDNIIAFPSGGSYIYMVPRNGGVAWHLNELPFYFENSNSMLLGHNFQEPSQRKKSSLFFRTPASSFIDNSRSESATVEITGSKAKFLIKQTLSGQFSTLLRPLYIGGAVDSSVSSRYFRRCVDKPGADRIQITATSASNEFPFRYTFLCETEVPLKNDSVIDLTGWFSFITGGSKLTGKPTHDYYFDFVCSDSYNFLLEFSEPTEIVNREAFSKTIVNNSFILQSEILEINPDVFAVRVKVVLLERRVPVESAGELINFARALDELSVFRLKIRPKT